MSMDVGANKPGQVKSDINVTPLVDVMLVLLIIFMVVTPMLQKGQAVVLPMAGNPEKKAEDKKNEVLVVVTAKHNDRTGRYEPGDIYVGEDKCTEAQFAAKIKEAFGRNSSAKLLVKADAKLNYGDVKKVMLHVQEAGFGRAGLIAQKRGEGS